MTIATKFGSLRDYEKGRVTIIDDDPRNYVFSNIFEVAAISAPYERIAVGKNFEYVIEAFRAEGESPWYSTAHDEFVVAMDGELEVHLIKLDNPDAVVAPDSTGAHRLTGDPEGRKMGRITLRRGHMALLPVGSAYRLSAAHPTAAIMQTISGPETVEKWATICQTQA
jgi:hypothetical protein